MTLPQKHIDRFWARVSQSDGCWLWQGYKDQDGYGLLFIQPRMRRAHRLAYEIATGENPGELSVLHRCDNPACVRPDHLFLGTNDDNMADMRAKGRGHQGQRNGRCILTPNQVREIRQRSTSYYRGIWTQLAREYGVNPVTIRSIAIRKLWPHLD